MQDRTKLRWLLVACTSLAARSTVHAQTPLDTGFTFQGELKANGERANGTFDLRFGLYGGSMGGSAIGSTLCVNDIAVIDGQFTVRLDFGSQFAGQQRFLEIEVRPDTGLGCASTAGFATLSPRQEITASPNAIFALNATTALSASSATTANTAISAGTATNALNIGGQPASNIALLNGNQTFSGVLNLVNPANTFTGSFSGNGSLLTALNGGSIQPGTIGRSKVGTDIESVLSQWPQLRPVLRSWTRSGWVRTTATRQL